MDVLKTLPHRAEGEPQHLSRVEDERHVVFPERRHRGVVDARDRRPAASLRYPAHALGRESGEEEQIGARLDVGGAPFRRFRLALADGDGVAAGDEHHPAPARVHRRPDLVLHVAGLDEDASFAEVLRLHVVLDHHGGETRPFIAPDRPRHRERTAAPVVGVGKDRNRNAVGDPGGHLDQLGDRGEPVVGDAEVRGRTGAPPQEQRLEAHFDDQSRRNDVEGAGTDHRVATREHRTEAVAGIRGGLGTRRSAGGARRSGPEGRPSGGAERRSAGSGRDAPQRFAPSHSVVWSRAHSVSPSVG